MKRTLLYYLNKNNDTLLPDASQVLPISDKEWYKQLEEVFNDLIWEYYSDRVVFIDQRFKIDDDDNTIISNIKRSFAINLKTRNYEYDKLYETTLLEYNPIWNVDGVIGTIHETTSNETNNQTHSGSDTLHKDGDDTIEHRGYDEEDHSGYDKHDHGGTDTLNYNRDQTNSTYKTTYDSAVTDPPGDYLSERQTLQTGLDNDYNEYNSYNQDNYFSKVKDTYTSDQKTKFNSDFETEYDSAMDGTKDVYQKDLDLNIRQGNVGVTMTQQMIEAERKVAMFDVFKKIVHDCVNTCTYSID